MKTSQHQSMCINYSFFESIRTIKIYEIMKKTFKVLWNVIGICLGILTILSVTLWHCDFTARMFMVCLAIWLLANKSNISKE